MLSKTHLLSFMIPVRAIDILLPLYVYPESSATWDPVNKAVAAFPSIHWQIIINPSTGPGTNASNPFPSDDYIAGIATLNRWPNVKTLGYVDTAWGKRVMSDVKADVDRFAAWTKYSYQDISMNGIFFDDVPSIYDFQDSPGTQAANESYFKAIGAYASTTIKGDSPVIFNSGNPGASSFFEYCDTMIEFENDWNEYQGQTTLKSITNDGGSLNKSAIIPVSVPTSLTTQELNSVVHTMKSHGVQFVGLTNDCCYNVLNGTLLTMLAAACEAANNSTDTTKAIVNGSATLVLGIRSKSECIVIGLIWAMLLAYFIMP